MFAIESHTVGVIEKQNIQWPLKFFWAGYYATFVSILWRHDDVIFWKNTFFEQKNRAVYQIEGL